MDTKQGKTYLAIIPNYWGKASTPEDALKRAKANAGHITKKVPYAIFDVEDPGAYCDEVDGSIMHRKGTKVTEVQRYEPPSLKRVK